MEGLEISVINKNKLEFENHTLRFDSEYLQKRYLKNLEIIKRKGFKNLSNYIEHISGGATPLGANYELEGIPFLRVQNIMQNYFNLKDVVYINNKQDEEIKRSRLKSKDVLLTITGVSYGKSATVNEELEGANINQHSVKITLNDKLNPYFLSTFLNSKFGKLQSDKNIVGVTRPALDYSVIRNFHIPNVSNDFQKEIENLLLKAANKISNSKRTFKQAENLLLQEIGLADFKPNQETINIKCFQESFVDSGRLDAEYYQPKYDQLELAIKKFGDYKMIIDIRTDNYRGLQPKYIEDGGLDIINSKHILDDTLDYNNFEKTSLIYWNEQERARVYKNDILTYTTGANIGRTQVYLKKKKALASNHVNILRLKEGFNSIYVGFVMNSLVGRLQTEKLSAGSAQAELYPKDIDKFIIPIINSNRQKQITNLINESFILKKQNEHLLEVAKKAVEIAIEESEKIALEFINKYETVAD